MSKDDAKQQQKNLGVRDFSSSPKAKALKLAREEAKKSTKTIGNEGEDITCSIELGTFETAATDPSLNTDNSTSSEWIFWIVGICIYSNFWCLTFQSAHNHF